LYERTHLRPRPQRFDELRAGNKARKHSQTQKLLGNGSTSPKEQNQSVKKEQGDYEFEGNSRRGSVSGSSANSACSDYDDSVSVYSSAGSVSGVDSYNNSPLMSSFAIPRASQSPQIPTCEVGGIRLPNAPLHDIASLHGQPGSPRKAATAPSAYFASNLARVGTPGSESAGGDYFGVGSRRTSMPVESPAAVQVGGDA